MSVRVRAFAKEDTRITFPACWPPGRVRAKVVVRFKALTITDGKHAGNVLLGVVLFSYHNADPNSGQG